MTKSKTVCNAPEAFSASTAALADGYDPPKALEESPVFSAASPTSSVSSIMQLRRYSWQPCKRNVAYGKSWQFVGKNKLTDTNSSLFSPQKPPLSEVHLTRIVRKIGQQERAKGKTITVNQLDAHCLKSREDMTSLSHSNRANSKAITVGNSRKKRNKFC